MPRIISQSCVGRRVGLSKTLSPYELSRKSAKRYPIGCDKIDMLETLFIENPRPSNKEKSIIVEITGLRHSSRRVVERDHFDVIEEEESGTSETESSEEYSEEMGTSIESDDEIKVEKEAEPLFLKSSPLFTPLPYLNREPSPIVVDSSPTAGQHCGVFDKGYKRSKSLPGRSPLADITNHLVVYDPHGPSRSPTPSPSPRFHVYCSDQQNVTVKVPYGSNSEFSISVNQQQIGDSQFDDPGRIMSRSSSPCTEDFEAAGILVSLKSGSHQITVNICKTS
ncbi:hypothetical protein SISNIDRAFT_516593 [Sistotremastrum niveocremeum HHB9708]|uniref:Uncharacterized protein n=1 Tax=Sistotremastrum niveocremeum HHB9708 TaxID=1314777 RepID=A0A164SPZ7_9AGAM|nr:hypothetical protein SISNIDRAFT_516593 [Sistotremastrum niveocremeum HHB9708]